MKWAGVVRIFANFAPKGVGNLAPIGITTAQLMRHVSSITDDYYFTIPRDELYVDGDPLISLERVSTTMQLLAASCL